MAALTLTGIHKQFGATTVLKGVDLQIRDGEFLTLVGPSGCGKTTLLRIIAGLDHADNGSVKIDDLPVDHLAPKQRDVAMVFQSYALYPYMTVAGNIGLPLTMRKLGFWQRMPGLGRLFPGTAAGRAAISSDVSKVADALGLNGLLDRRPAQLSGGQRQRVALARAMVRNPKVFLMDEPLSNLDAKLRATTRGEISELHRRLKSTFVYVTHDQVEAMTMSDRVALMLDGQIVQLAAPQELYDNPSDIRVAEFIGTPKINTIRAEVEAGGLRVNGELWPGLIDSNLVTRDVLTLAIRCESWTLGEYNRSAPGCSIRGEVSNLEPLGGETLVHVRPTRSPENLIASIEPRRALTLRRGDLVTLYADPAKVLLFDTRGHRVRLAGHPTSSRSEVLHG